MKESIIESEVCKYAKNLGYLVFKLHSSKGIPDRLFIKNGKVIFVEFKATKGRLQNFQKLIIERLKEENMQVYIINNVNDAKKLLHL